MDGILISVMETVNSTRGSGRGRGQGSRPRPGPPSWPHGTVLRDRGKYTTHAREAGKSRELPDIDWDEMRRQVSEVSYIWYKYLESITC